MSGEPKCQACGIPWTEHAGAMNQCEQLQDARAEIKRLHAELAETTKAGTPYSAERDKINGLVLENERLKKANHDRDRAKDE